MKTTHLFILVVTFIATAKADYFAGILADQKLAADTNTAINSLKDTLITNLDCSDKPKKKIEQSFGGTVVLGPNTNVQAQKQSLLFQSLFRKNNDRSILTFNRPRNKSSFDSSTGVKKKQQLYQKCVTVVQYLQKIKEIFKGFNNVVLGTQNKVNGSKNFVAGSRDNINGNNNWVFTSDLTLNTVQDGVIVIENYLIELVDINLIAKNPSQAIRCITTEESNGKLKKWWGRPTVVVGLEYEILAGYF